MITIFRGRKLSLDGTKDEIYAQVAVALRDQIHLFHNGKNLNPFGLFMKLALHTDEHGWSYPGRANIKRSTGIASNAAITSALKQLCTMRIEGYPVMAMYRTRDEKVQWGRTVYRIFPSAWNDGFENLPKEFKNMKPIQQYTDDQPGDDLPIGDLVIGHLPLKKNYNKGKPNKEDKPSPETGTISDPDIENSESEIKAPKTPEIQPRVDAKPPRPLGVDVFREVMDRFPRKTWWTDIEKAVGSDPADLDRWRKVVHTYDGLGWNPTNVVGMLEWFDRNEIPNVKGAKRARSGIKNHEVATPSTVRAFEAYRAEQRRAARVEEARPG